MTWPESRKNTATGCVLMGGWDSRGRLGETVERCVRGRLGEPDVTDEEIRQSVRDTIDLLAPGGGFCWCGGYLGAVGDTEADRKNKVLREEVYRYGDIFYS